jgi:putative hydrolase of the HAD superfamily
MKGAVLFDWGDTLMRDLAEYNGPMKDWPRVEAVPAAADTLAALHSDWTLAVATNAADSEEPDIRAALRRLDLDRWIDRIYCFRNIGHRKPSSEFFDHIIKDLALSPERIVMVGDNYEVDVLGALHSGLYAIWFNEFSTEGRVNRRCRTVHTLADIPALLNDLEPIRK